MELNIKSAIRPGDKLEIHYINRQNKDLLLETSVYDILSDDKILINNPVIEHKLYMIPMNINVTVFCKRNDYGVIAFQLTLVKRKKVDNVYTIQCKLVSEIKKQQRRHYFRVKVFFDIDIYFMQARDGHPVDYYIFDPDAVEEIQVDLKATILDISGGGVGVKTSLPIPESTIIYAKLGFLSGISEVHGVVVRSVASSKYDGEYELGIAFLDLKPEIQRTITSYVFSKQQMARRKEID